MQKGDKLLIRADANKKIGMGHVMRCLTIAEAANQLGVETEFLVADEMALELLLERGQKVTVLHSDFAHMEEELPTLKNWLEQLAQENQRLVFLLDSYQITEKYVKELGQVLRQSPGKLVLLSDYGEIPGKADGVINYNIYGTDFAYGKLAAQALLGCEYMPLRPVFGEQNYEVRESAKHVLVLTGGSDYYRIGETLVQKLTSQEDLFIHVVCGKFSESLETLEKLAEQNEQVKVYRDVKEMWELMAKCDVAVSAAGTTLYELCAVGVPTVCFSFAENQILPGKTFHARTPMVYAGDYEKDKEAMFAEILREVRRICAMSARERREISDTLRKLVDGKGAWRIVAAL